MTSAKVWALDRRVFQQVMKKTGLQRIDDNLKFLRSVPLFERLTTDHMSKIADVLEVVSIITNPAPTLLHIPSTAGYRLERGKRRTKKGKRFRLYRSPCAYPISCWRISDLPISFFVHSDSLKRVSTVELIAQKSQSL